MKLGLFMMPVHPMHRPPSATLREHREAIILADQLGFHDSFVGEHLTDKLENISNSMIFLASLILALREQTGNFGELVYAGIDWADPALACRSMQLMAEQVMPRVNVVLSREDAV